MEAERSVEMRPVPRVFTRIPFEVSSKVRLFASPTTPARNLLERTRSSMGYLMECPFGGEPIRYRPSQTPARRHHKRHPSV